MEENQKNKKAKMTKRQKRMAQKRQEQEAAMTPEEKFNQLLALKKATRCILSINETYKIYARLAGDFERLGKEAEEQEQPFEGWEQCQALSEECRQKAEELDRQRPVEEEYSRTVTTTVREQEAAGKKRGRARWVVLAAVLLLVLAAVSYKATPTRYIIAGAEESMGLHRQARESYHKLGDYKDSHEREKVSAYAYACSLVEEGRTEEARKVFSRLATEDYSDSADREVELEQKLLLEAKPGDTVIFGSRRWRVLEQRDSQALLILDKKMKSAVYDDEARTVTWEKCTLREKLNADFINKICTPQEIKAVCRTHVKSEDNPVYGTKGGKDTVDTLFLLSAGEAEDFKEVLGRKGKNLCLRTPGRDGFSVMYLSNLREPVSYGAPVEMRGLAVRPAMWVATRK